MLICFQIMIIVLLILGYALGVIRIRHSKMFINEYFDLNKEDRKNYNYSDVAIVIPVYNEQNIIEDSILSFMPLIKAGINTYYITTNKEKESIKTRDLLELYIDKYNIGDYCHIINYKYENGVMAHQLNYAIKSFDNNKIIFVYNVDSKIDLRTINYVLRNQVMLENGVFQQYSYSRYTSNKFINAAIDWQNRWSIAFEMAKAINSKKKYKWYNFNYVIGHGLVFRKKMFKEFGGFSEKDINEDNVLGYVLNLKKIEINPIPYLEEIGFAENLKIYIKQQSVWFNGPLYAFKYYSYLHKNYNFKYSQVKQLIMAAINFRLALNWLVFPLCCIYILLYSIVTLNLLLFCSINISLYLYVYRVNKLSKKVLIDLNEGSHNPNALITCFHWLLIHSVGPIITLWKILRGVNNQHNKYKTEKSYFGNKNIKNI